jgi:hypothetical protein
MALASEAGAAVLCQKKSGTILVRPDACKKKETSFDLTPFVAPLIPVTETVVVTGSSSTEANTNDAELTVACPAGFRATGGGVAGEFNQVGVDASGPTIGGQPTNVTPDGTTTTADGWFVRVYSFQGDVEPFKASVICVKP